MTDIEEIKAEHKIMGKVLRHAQYLQPAEYEMIKRVTVARRIVLASRIQEHRYQAQVQAMTTIAENMEPVRMEVPF